MEVNKVHAAGLAPGQCSGAAGEAHRLCGELRELAGLPDGERAVQYFSGGTGEAVGKELESVSRGVRGQPGTLPQMSLGRKASSPCLAFASIRIIRGPLVSR